MTQMDCIFGYTRPRCLDRRALRKRFIAMTVCMKKSVMTIGSLDKTKQINREFHSLIMRGANISVLVQMMLYHNCMYVSSIPMQLSKNLNKHTNNTSQTQISPMRYLFAKWQFIIFGLTELWNLRAADMLQQSHVHIHRRRAHTLNQPTGCTNTHRDQ